MTSTLRLFLIPLAVALACSLAVSAVVMASGRPTVLISSPSASTSTFETGVFTSGDATVSIKPDLATVSAGVESQQSTAAAAQSDLAAKAGKLIARIKSLGVSDADLSTSGYWVGPVYAVGGQTITGYQANEVLRVEWHNVDTVGKTLDAIVQEGGATNINVGFGVKDPKPAEAQARTLAIVDAHSKAQAMASAAGVRLGQVLRVSDVATATRPPIQYAGAAVPGASTQVPVGQVDVQVSVEVDYAIA
ncbi:MAG TPA: SIMPL domain-containing protein [Streptosporangiaceae bacterium]|nr:SIMPL domain-containing protein [Streptosporangiaceae bacterium]